MLRMTLGFALGCPQPATGALSMTTLDYDGETAAPMPVSETVESYLRKSISLSDIFTRLFRGWFFALAGALLGVVIGIYVVWATPPS